MESKGKGTRMKKLLLSIGIIIWVFIFVTPFTFAGYIETTFGQRSFPFERGIVHYQSVDGHGRKETSIFYIDGKKTAREKYRENKLYEITIDDGEYIYLVIPEYKKAKKDYKGTLSKFYEGLYDKKSAEQINVEIEKFKDEHIIGKETILNKECDIYQFITEYTVKKAWQWGDLVLKEEMTEKESGRVYYSMIATKIEVDASIPKGKFQVPKDIEIKEIKNWRDQEEWAKEDAQRQWEDIPEETREKIQSSPEYEALKKMADSADGEVILPDAQAEITQMQVDWMMEDTYKQMGLDLTRTLERAEHNANESAAIATFKTITAACQSYKDGEGHYPQDLKALADAKPPYIMKKLGEGKYYGYYFVYRPTTDGYKIIANPITPGITGTKRYFINQTGDIRFTSDGTEPSVDSETLNY